MWLIILSDQLPIVGLVGRYLTNYLMGRRPIFRHPLGTFNNCHHAVPLHHRVLAPISRSYSRPEGRLPTCYSPLRRFTQDIATLFSLDLHVLGTPPAFVLSQDQTLRCNYSFSTSSLNYGLLNRNRFNCQGCKTLFN